MAYFEASARNCLASMLNFIINDANKKNQLRKLQFQDFSSNLIGLQSKRSSLHMVETPTSARGGQKDGCLRTMVKYKVKSVCEPSDPAGRTLSRFL